MMAISDIDREQFRRATDRLKASELDALTQESSYDALTAAEAMLVEPSDHNTATAVAKLTLFLAHFASGSPKAAANAATKAVEDHEKSCTDKRRGSTTTPSSMPATKLTLMAFVDRNIKWFFYAFVVLAILVSLSTALQDIARESAATALEQRSRK